MTSDCLLSTDKIASNQRISYPNPTSDLLYFNPSLPIDKIEVYDASGRLLLTKTSIGNHVDLSGFSAGTYIVKLHSRERSRTEKILITN